MKKNIEKLLVSGLIAVFVMSLVIGLVPYDLIPTVSAASSKKAPIHINNTAGGALSYYQINLNITYDSDMNNNFSDLRVKNETAGAFVPYWVEDKVDGSYANIWFEGNVSSGWDNDTHALYYGDAGASSESNGTNTFEYFTNSDCDEWERNPNNPVMGYTAAGQWDVRGCSESNVILHNDTYFHYYQGFDSDASNQIGLATASSLWTNNWTRYASNPIIGFGAGGEWDANRAGHPGFLVDIETRVPVQVNGKYQIFYIGHNVGHYEDSKVGRAESTDLYNWTKYSGNPIFTPAAENIYASHLSVVKDGDTYYMVYGLKQPGTELHIAHSTDLNNWTEDGLILDHAASGWDSGGVSYPQILKRDGVYYLIYVGYVTPSNYVEKMGYATATNITGPYTKYSENPIFSPKISGWDNHAISDCWIIRDSDVDYLFYAGESTTDSKERIGVARIDDFTSYIGITWDEYTDRTGGNVERVDTPQKRSSSKAFGYIQESNSVYGYWRDLFLQQTGKFIIEVDVRLPQTDKLMLFTLTTNQTSFLSTNGGPHIRFNDAGTIEIYTASTWETIQSYNADQWYKMKLIVSLVDDDVDVYIDDVLKLSDRAFYMDNNLDNLSQINLGGYHTSRGTSYIQDARLRKYISPEPTTTLGTEQSVEEGDCTTPVISDLTNSTAGTTNVIITWSTNQSADNRVKYSKNSDLSNEEWSSWDNDTSSISIELSSLDSGMPYYYQAWSYNGTNSSCSITEPVSSPYKTFTTQSTGGAYNITLFTGWNIIGWTDTTTRTAHYIGTDIGSNCTYISERNKTSGNYVNHNMEGPEEEDNFAIERGWGYYAYLSAETLWERSA